MEKYRESIKKKIKVSFIYIGILAVVACLIAVRMFTDDKDGFISGYVYGVQFGACLGVMAVMIAYISSYIKAIKTDKALKELYIKQNDEREILIQQKAGGTSMAIVIGTLGLGMVVSGFFNTTVFFTLMAATFLVSFITLGVKCYYTKKL